MIDEVHPPIMYFQLTSYLVTQPQPIILFIVAIIDQYGFIHSDS